MPVLFLFLGRRGPDRRPTLLGSFDNSLSTRGAESALGLQSFRLGGCRRGRFLADGCPPLLLCVGDPFPRSGAHLPPLAAACRCGAACRRFARATTEFLPDFGNPGIEARLLRFEPFNGSREYFVV